jgi:hypothetical protein
MLQVRKRAVALGALACVAMAGIVVTSRSMSWVSLATAAELREITWAERSDMKPSNLAAKNDDGHTRIWDAAGNLVKSEHHSRKAAVADRGRNFYGMPKFFAHSTGYVQDYVSQRDGFGLPARKAAPAQLQAVHTQELLQLPVQGKKMSESAKATAFADPPASQACEPPSPPKSCAYALLQHASKRMAEMPLVPPRSRL